MNNLPPLKQDEYDITCPADVTFIWGQAKGNKSESMFIGYGNSKGGKEQICPAKRKKLIRNKGDVVVAIDGVFMPGKSHQEFLSFLKKKKKNANISLRMRDSAVGVVSSQQHSVNLNHRFIPPPLPPPFTTSSNNNSYKECELPCSASTTTSGGVASARQNRSLSSYEQQQRQLKEEIDNHRQAIIQHEIHLARKEKLLHDLEQEEILLMEKRLKELKQKATTNRPAAATAGEEVACTTTTTTAGLKDLVTTVDSSTDEVKPLEIRSTERVHDSSCLSSSSSSRQEEGQSGSSLSTILPPFPAQVLSVPAISPPYQLCDSSHNTPPSQHPPRQQQQQQGLKKILPSVTQSPGRLPSRLNAQQQLLQPTQQQQQPILPPLQMRHTGPRGVSNLPAWMTNPSGGTIGRNHNNNTDKNTNKKNTFVIDVATITTETPAAASAAVVPADTKSSFLASSTINPLLEPRQKRRRRS